MNLTTQKIVHFKPASTLLSIPSMKTKKPRRNKVKTKKPRNYKHPTGHTNIHGWQQNTNLLCIYIEITPNEIITIATTKKKLKHCTIYTDSKASCMILETAIDELYVDRFIFTYETLCASYLVEFIQFLLFGCVKFA